MTVVRTFVHRAAVVAGGVVALIVLAAPSARAHGPTPDASNYRSTIAAIVAMDGGEPAGTAGSPPGVSWRVLGADALLQVRNTGDDDLVVAGYDGEPFLRIGPEGVFENRRSPATYLNADRYGMTQVPQDADADAPPEWRRVGAGPQWHWHDHRIHWMSRTQPPQAQQRPDAVQTISEWTVPFEVGGQHLAVEGVLRWIPPGPVWPWLVGAAAAVSLPVAVPLVRRAGERRVTRALVAVTTVVAVATVVVAVGDVIATPASAAADAFALLQTVAPAGVAVALAVSQWRWSGPEEEDVSDPAATLLIATVILAIACGAVRMSALQSSQLVNALAPWVVRSGIAASLTVVAPALLVMVVTGRRTRTPEPASWPPQIG